MELVVETLAQAPFVALVAYIWWQNRSDSIKEMQRLQERVARKDSQIEEFIKVFDRLNLSLELIKERLK